MNPKPPHRKRIRHYEGQGHLHELTFSTYQRLPILTSEPWRKILANELDAACDAEGFGLVAFVFMPEHVHLLIQPEREAATVSRLLGRMKRQTAISVKALLIEHQSDLLQKLTVQEGTGQSCFRFWQQGPGFDRNLFGPQAIEASIDYIHTNPVKRRLCQRAVDWKWSSARFYVEGQLEPDWPRLKKLESGTLNRSSVWREHS